MLTITVIATHMSSFLFLYFSIYYESVKTVNVLHLKTEKLHIKMVLILSTTLPNCKLFQGYLEYRDIESRIPSLHPKTSKEKIKKEYHL